MSRIISTLLLGVVLTMLARPALAVPAPREWFWRDACGSCPATCALEFYDCPCFRYTAEDMKL
jgi:hypothetical protein